MNLMELKRKIKNNATPNFMIWVGPETYVKRFYREKITKNWVFLDDISTLNINPKSLFKGIKSFYYIDGQSLNDIPEKEFRDNDLKSKLLNSPNMIIFDFRSSCLDSNSDKNKPNKFILKEFKDYIIFFEQLSERLLLKYFKSTNLSEDKLKNIFSWNSNDYIKIQLEIDKILCYASQTNLSPDIAFDVLLKDNLLNKPVGDVIFNFSGALLSGDLNLTNYWYKQLKLSGEHVLTVASLLYKQFKDVYIVKKGEKEPELINSLNYSSGRLWHLRQNAKAYSLKELERNLKVIQFVESGIKSGKINEDVAMDYMIINLLG